MRATQGARRATGVAPTETPLNPPDPEVMEKNPGESLLALPQSLSGIVRLIIDIQSFLGL